MPAITVIKGQDKPNVGESVSPSDIADKPFRAYPEAAAHLKEKYGKPCAVTPITLTKPAVNGGENVHSSDIASEPFLSRPEAAAYLKEKYGPGAVTPKTLAKLAVTGGGPVMHRFGRRVSYKPEDLDLWAMSRCSGPVRSTSDRGNGNGSR